jgi:hypothetical protein
MNAPDLGIAGVEVVLNLELEVAPENRERFFDFCRRAFPVYESNGGNRMFLYEDASRPGRFNEAGYYRTMADYKRSEDAITNDPAQARLIAKWRSLLLGAPKATIYRRTPA